MASNIIHRYYKKTLPEGIIMVQINPIDLSGLELLINNEGKMRKTVREFDEDIYDDLESDGFDTANQLEFNLYLKQIPT